jgi:hypothetical protein
LGALQQVVTEVTGSAPETTTAIVGMIDAITNDDKAAFLRRNGIRLREDDGVTYRSLAEIMKDVIRVTGGGQEALSRVFDDSAKTALAGLAKSYDAEANTFGKLDALLAIRGDGSGLLADARLNADGFNAAARNILTAAERFADEQLSGPVQSLADALNSLTTEQQNAVMWGGLALGGGSLAYVGGKSLLGALGRGGAASGAGQVAGALANAAGPTPVMVTNWPRRMRDRSPRTSPTTAATVAGAAGAGVGATNTAAATAALGQRMRLRWLARGSGAVALGIGAYEVGSALAEGDGRGAVEAGGSAAGAAAGAWGGAQLLGGAGAMTGPAAPVLAPAGALIGALGGGFLGSEVGHEIAEAVIDRLERWEPDWHVSITNSNPGVAAAVALRRERRRGASVRRRDDPDAGPTMPGVGR